MRKFELVFKKVAKVRSNLRGNVQTLFAKEVIGAATNNNRTLTVNQTIQYLEAIGQKKLAKQVKAAYSVLRPTVQEQRIYDGVLRTDAIDIDEFVRVYREEVMNTKNLRKQVSNALRGV